MGYFAMFFEQEVRGTLNKGKERERERMLNTLCSNIDQAVRFINVLKRKGCYVLLSSVMCDPCKCKHFH